MTSYVFAPAPQVSIPVVGTDARFPVRRVYCVGRNYQAHRAEMGNNDRDPPIFFAKPADAIVTGGADVAYPTCTENYHHEVELVVALKSGGSNIPMDKALDCVFGYAVGVDMTRRDIQRALSAKGAPWEACKGFDQSGPVSDIVPATAKEPLGRIWLTVDGEKRQDAVVADMIWNVKEIIAEASKLWRLEAGDVIFTGTPEGVGPVTRGQTIACGVEDVGELTFKVV
jgi:fumarylpyruvate hydrolase